MYKYILCINYTKTQGICVFFFFTKTKFDYSLNSKEIRIE